MSNISTTVVKQELYRFFDKKLFNFSVKLVGFRFLTVEVLKSPLMFRYQEDFDFMYGSVVETHTNRERMHKLETLIWRIIDSKYPVETCIMGKQNYHIVIDYGKKSQYSDDYAQYKQSKGDISLIYKEIDKKLNVISKLKSAT